LGSANPDPRALLVKRGGLAGIGDGETCPAGLGRGKHALGGWLGQFSLGLFDQFVIRQLCLFNEFIRQLFLTSSDLTTTQSIFFKELLFFAKVSIYAEIGKLKDSKNYNYLAIYVRYQFVYDT